MKREVRSLERKSNDSGLNIDAEIYDLKQDEYNHCLNETKKSYYNNAVLDYAKDQGVLFSLTNKLLHRTSSSPLPSFSSPTQLANAFSNFFEGKIVKIHLHLSNFSDVDSDNKYDWPEVHAPAELTTFSPISQKDFDLIFTKSPNKFSSLDPLPTSVLHQVHKKLLSFITALINKSISIGHVSYCFKEAMLTPILKKPNLDSQVVNAIHGVLKNAYFSIYMPLRL